MSQRTKQKGGIFPSITGFFQKSKNTENKGGSQKEKKKDKSNGSPDTHAGEIASPPANTPAEEGPAKVEALAQNGIGRGSHTEADSNTIGDPSHPEATQDAQHAQHAQHPQHASGDQSQPAQKEAPKTLSPQEVTQKRKSGQPAVPHDNSGELAVSNSSENGSASGSGLRINKINKKTSSNSGKDFVPLTFFPKDQGSDTPTAKVRQSGPPEILPEEITYEESDLVGHGSFGSVYKGRCRGQEVAVKVPKKQKLTMAELTSFRNEVKIMSLIYHPHVVLFLGACTQLGKMQIITERCMTDLEKLLANDREKKSLSLPQRVQMAKDAALGVNWLHSKCGIFHMDLKSANLLLDHNMRVKVTDFGFSQIKESGNPDKAKKGTPLWMAPEVMMGNKYDEKADVYSFGIILWEILTREIPYAHHNDYQTFFRSVCIDKERPPIPPGTPASLEHLITSCWDFNPQKRPGFEEIIFRLNVVLVDCLIDSEEGRDLWKQHFLLPKQELVEQVPWSDFEVVLKKSIGKHNVHLDKLPQFIVSASRDPILREKKVVTMERFDKVIKWFGLFFDSEVGPSIIEEVNELVSKPWFHCDVSKELAMDRLSKQEEGTFLIRLSSTDPKTSPFTLSMINNQHRRIRRCNVEEDGTVGYIIQGKPTIYKTLVELAEKCVDYPLKTPCPQDDDTGYADPYRVAIDLSQSV